MSNYEKNIGESLTRDETLIQDALENFVANMGTMHDKRSHSKFVNRSKLEGDAGRKEIDALYRTNWVAGKMVDIIPDDMTRNWRTFNGLIEPDVIKVLEKLEEDIDLQGAFNEAHTWARLYGTAFIMPVIAGTEGNVSEPFDPKFVKPGSLTHLTVIDRFRIDNITTHDYGRRGASQFSNVTMDPFNRNFGMPEKYRLRNSSVEIHHSWLIRFDGVKLPYDELVRQNYWSDGILNRLYDAILDFTTATTAASSLIHEANVDIIKIRDLMSYLSNDEMQATLMKRMRLAKTLKSNNNILMLDSSEEHDSKSATFTGVADLTTKFAQFLTAAGDVPATRFLGVSSSGFNSTGEGDDKNYKDRIASDQVKYYRPKLNIMDTIMARSLGLPDDADLSYKFNSLFQLTESETADVELKNSQRDTQYLQSEVIKPSVIAKALREEGVYSNITDEDIAELEKLEEEADDLSEFEGMLTGSENDEDQDEENDEENDEDQDEENDE